MDLSPLKYWKSRCFMHLANYPSRSSPTNFGDETKVSLLLIWTFYPSMVPMPGTPRLCHLVPIQNHVIVAPLAEGAHAHVDLDAFALVLARTAERDRNAT